LKKNECFECLSYGRIDILIPQSKNQPDKKDEFTSLNLDDAVATLFNEEINLGNVVELKNCRYENIVPLSGITPQSITIPFSEICILTGPIGEFLASKGICGFRFHEGKMQYILDIESFCKNGSKFLCGSIEDMLSLLEGDENK